MSTSIRDALRTAAQQIKSLPHASPHLEAELLLCAATGLNRARLLAWPEAEIGNSQLARFQALVSRRIAGEPIAYIRGYQAFWTQDLMVTEDTLIPRPETELLVELALEHLPADGPLLVADAGSGSGAIITALASERPGWNLVATERDLKAARVALQNLKERALGNTQVVNCDWLTPIAERSLQAVISNPPYIADTDPHLDWGDLPYEPKNALAAGSDGLDAIRVLSAQAASRLRPGGFIALEHGYGQGHAVRAILARHGFEGIVTHRDLSNWERATTGLLAG